MAHRFDPLRRLVMGAVLMLALTPLAALADLSRFAGVYEGEGELTGTDGSVTGREMRVEIDKTRDGFRVEWHSLSVTDEGKRTGKSYDIRFVPSERDAIFAAAMKRDVFGNSVPLNPLKGEPYVWARLRGDTLTVYSLFVDEDGEYTLQQYDRTLVEGGMDLHFRSMQDGATTRSLKAFLARIK